MPGFDGTGPMSQGPMTGRGMGYCGTGSGVPTGGAPVYGRGRGGQPWGGGRGFGGGRGLRGAGPRGRFAGQQQFAGSQDERGWLQRQADALQQQLDGIRSRLQNLDQDS